MESLFQTLFFLDPNTIHLLDSMYKLQNKRLKTLGENSQSELHNLTILTFQVQNAESTSIDTYMIQFLAFRNTSCHNSEHRLTIVSNNFSPLSNSTCLV